MPNSESIQIYFNKKDYGDIRKRIERVGQKRSASPYSRISTSDVARQLLLEKLDEEEGRIEIGSLEEKRNSKENGA